MPTVGFSWGAGVTFPGMIEGHTEPVIDRSGQGARAIRPRRLGLRGVVGDVIPSDLDR